MLFRIPIAFREHEGSIVRKTEASNGCSMICISIGLLGILRIDVKGDHNVYSLKNEYKNSVKATMDNY